MFYKNKINGFTLVELLVTISILGIITAMSLPVIRNIIEANTLKKYTTYKDSVESSAKLYVDSYSEDLLGKNKSGCAYITYDQMKSKNLIKNIQENGISCDSDKTYVRVVKINGKYSYATQIGCGNSSDKEKITSSKVNVVYPKNGVEKNETCSYDAVTKLSVSVDPENYEKTDKKKYAVKIILESFTGINNGVQVSYAWHKEGTDASNDVWQVATFRGISSSKQEEEILNAKKVELKSGEILTPNKETGNYKLLVKVNRAMDITGNNLITDLNEINTFDIYKIDNLAPVISSLSVSSREPFFGFKGKVNINATDNNMMSSQKEVKVCIKTDTSSCSSNDYKIYDSSYDVTIPGKKYDGSTKKIYVYVKDNAGNVTSSTADYTLYKECSISILDSSDFQKKGECSVECGGGTRLDTYGKKDKYTGAKCDGTAMKKEKCNTRKCCDETSPEPQAWSSWSECSASCGGGSQTRSRTVIYKSAYDSSIECKSETENASQSCNTMGCCSLVNYSDGQICSKKCGGGTYNRIARSAYNNTACPSLNTSNGGSQCNTNSCSIGTMIYDMRFKEKSCSSNPPVRKYDYGEYYCTCTYDSSTGNYSSSSVVDTTGGPNGTPATGHSGSKIATVYYQNNGNGRKACNNEKPVNSYVTKICAHSMNNGDAFHGYIWYTGEAGAYKSFSGTRNWLHGPGLINDSDRVVSRNVASDAKKACAETCKMYSIP